jgi:hypothetical protein
MTPHNNSKRGIRSKSYQNITVINLGVTFIQAAIIVQTTVPNYNQKKKLYNAKSTLNHT